MYYNNNNILKCGDCLQGLKYRLLGVLDRDLEHLAWLWSSSVLPTNPTPRVNPQSEIRNMPHEG